jgi:nicotinate-nucleotide adenylyltransferase
MGAVGIIGGTFDPPHNAHLEMARQALEHLPLDRILFMPAPDPPHKRAETPYEKRIAMVMAALRGEARMELSRMEEFRKGPSYTVDLIEFYRAGNDDDVYFIMGSDSLLELGSWKDPERLLRLATLVVFKRPGFEPVNPVKGEASVILFEEPLIDVSSSGIRERVRRGESIRSLVPEPVRKFILDNSLYS